MEKIIFIVFSIIILSIASLIIILRFFLNRYTLKQEDTFGEAPLEEADDEAEGFETTDLILNGAPNVDGHQPTNQKVKIYIYAT